MTKFCTAELREQGVFLASENVKYIREQAAVSFFLENRFADVGGLASYSGPGRSLEKNGLRVLHKSVPQPYFPLIAGKRISGSDVGKIKTALSDMGATVDDAAILKSVGVQGFETSGQDRLAKLLVWLGGS